MAIYHLRLKVVSRALGRAAKAGGAQRRSAVAAAAYRSGERLFDTLQGKWFRFDKPEVIHTEILAPTNTTVPPWVFDRQTLWNMVERSEKRKDAQVAREVELTLPRELSHEQQIALVRSFARDQFVDKGMVADVSIHEPLGADGLPQPHAHILLTMRRLDSGSETGFARKKDRDWNEPEPIALAVAEARKRFNDTGAPEDKLALEAAEARRNVNVWRASWASYANRSLEEMGSPARIDHRTLEAQGIARPPQPNLGFARHVEKAYAYLKDRLTQWVAVQKRSMFYRDVLQYQRRDPVKMAEFVLRIADIAEDIVSHYRRPPPPVPEVELER
jgi:ATP-dependent exoDNAse (exonuclease V) alpha subunit